MDSEKVKVLFIGGCHRSGSTLLDMMLGQVEGFFSIGELREIWSPNFDVNQLCGCGKKFKECEFWGNVVEEAFGSFQNADFGEIKELRRSTDRIWYIPQLVSPWRTARYRARFSAYSQILSKLYGAIKKVSGSRFIIDSSKFASHGFVLNALPDIELYVVHLIRDSRAVAYSWQRKKLKPEIHWKEEYLPVYSTATTSLEWNLSNILVHMLMYVNQHYTLLQYEDLVRDPQGTLLEVLAYLGERTPSLEFLDRFKFELRSNHTVSGNPMRFQRGRVEVRPDIEWREKMDKRQKILVTTLTWPFLLRCGYFRIHKI